MGRRSLGFVVRVGLTAGLVATGGTAWAVAAPTAIPQAPALAEAPPSPRAMVSAIPSSATPEVDNGSVHAIAPPRGNVMLMGGDFTSVDGQPRANLAAFDVTNGNLLPQLINTNGRVNTMIAGPTATTVFIGGTFTQVAGVARHDLALFDVTTWKPVPTWVPPEVNFGDVNSLLLVGTRLYVTGTFTKMNNQTREGLASVVASSGALDSFMTLSFTGHHNDSGSGAQGKVGVDQIAITPDGTRMVAIGNFKFVNGTLRDQVAMVNLTGSAATLRTDWATDWYKAYCNKKAVDSWVRGVAFSPDGSYFVVTGKGGFHPGTGCDATLRYETNNFSLHADPTWHIETGGDTLWGTVITENAIYVGGHQRWANNPTIRDKAGPGAVPRPGLMALDPLSGRPLAWNPGRDPRGVAVFVLLALDTGVYLGSNTGYIGSHDYFRPRIAFFPYAGGAQLVATTTKTLPGNLYIGAPRSRGNAARLFKIGLDATGHSTSALTDTGIAFGGNPTGAFLVGDQLYNGDATAKTLYRRTFTGTTLSAAVAVEPYHDPAWKNVSNGSGGTYDGNDPTLYNQFGTVTGAAYASGQMLFTESGKAGLSGKWFSPDSGIMDERTQSVPSSVNLSGAVGMFVTGGKLYYVVKTTGALWSATWTGSGVTGSPTQVGGPGVDGVDYTGAAMFLGP